MLDVSQMLAIRTMDHKWVDRGRVTNASTACRHRRMLLREVDALQARIQELEGKLEWSERLAKQATEAAEILDQHMKVLLRVPK